MLPQGAPAKPILISEAGEVAERAGNEGLSTRVLSLRSGGEQFDEITSGRCHLGPRRHRGGEEKMFQFFLAISQRGLIFLNLVNVTTNFGIFLSSHPAALVEIDQLVTHGRGPFPRRACVATGSTRGWERPISRRHDHRWPSWFSRASRSWPSIAFLMRYCGVFLSSGGNRRTIV